MGTESNDDVRRQLGELVEELRVALPGVQVLFGFLLGLPFTSRFEQVSTENRTTYFIAFLASAVASILLIAPSAIHRVVHGDGGDRLWLVRTASWLAVAGMLGMVVAISASVFLVSDVIYNSSVAAGAAAAIAALAASLWFILPLARRSTRT